MIKFLVYKWLTLRVTSPHVKPPQNKDYVCDSLMSHVNNNKKENTPAVLQYLREKQSPVVFPAAIFTQDVRLFIHHSLLIINNPLLFITQHRIQLS